MDHYNENCVDNNNVSSNNEVINNNMDRQSSTKQGDTVIAMDGPNMQEEAQNTDKEGPSRSVINK